MEPETDPVWYVAYASNLAIERLRYYLVGGRPLGSLRTYDGARNPSEPIRTRPVELSGALVFAGRSLAWAGGIAFYDPQATGTVAARAYLLEAQQVNDLVAQEIRRSPGTELDLVAPHPNTSRPLGSSAYDIAIRHDDLEGHPAVSITTSRSPMSTRPSPSYLLWICRGLRETYDWTPWQVADYLGRFAGVRGTWSAEDLIDLASYAGLDA